jgi:hypothetical protein
MALPILLYKSEIWILMTRQLKWIETSEMKLLRTLGGYALRVINIMKTQDK